MQHETIDTATRIKSWMVAYMADVLDIPQTEVDPTMPFDQYGLDSAATVAFTSDLSNHLGVKLDSRLMAEYDTVDRVAAHLGPELESRGGTIPA